MVWTHMNNASSSETRASSSQRRSQNKMENDQKISKISKLNVTIKMLCHYLVANA